MLRRHLWKASEKTKMLAYYTLVRPRLEYAACAWDPAPPSGQIKSLEMVKRRAARYICNTWSREPGTVTALLQHLKWITLEERRIRQRLLMLYKIVNGLVAINKETYLTAPARFTRSARPGTFVQYSISKDCLGHSFFPRTLIAWNTLPEDVIASPDLATFRHMMADARKSQGLA